jgi:hypothetical protein
VRAAGGVVCFGEHRPLACRVRRLAGRNLSANTPSIPHSVVAQKSYA